MADEVVVTELVIDSRQAEVGSAAYVAAMKRAQAAYDKTIDQANAATVAMEKQGVVMTGAAGSISSTAKAWDRFKASVDPAFAATQRMEKALITADTAARKLGVDQAEINRVLDLARAKHLGTAVAVEETATAAKLGSAQMMSLSHAARSAAESIALGAPASQVFTQQLNHLSFAMSGPQGLIAASAGVRAAFGAWLTTIPGLISTAGVAAVAGVAVYMLATREDIKSVDEILAGHKALLDEVAATYPHLTAELKKYETEAAKLPHSVVAADTATQIKNDQATLAASLDHLKVDLRDLARAPDVVGTAGAEAFGKLADTIDAGNVDVGKLVSSIGDLRLDPNLTPSARDFADGLQGAANEAQKLADTLAKDQGLKSINDAGGKTQKTLADVAKGFKDTNSQAAGADASISKLFGTLNSGGDARFGVSKAAGSFDGLLGQFAQADAAIQQTRRNQVESQLELTKQFRDTTTQVDVLKEAIASAAGRDNVDAFFGNVSNIANANSELQRSVEIVGMLFDDLNAGNRSAQAVASGLDMVRAALVQDGFGVDQVNKFIDGLIRARMQMDADISKAAQLDRTIQAIKDRTITITVVTRQIGTGTQTISDVPNQTGGMSSVGVTRYSSNGPAVSSTPIFNTSTNSWGYTQPKTYQDPRVLAQVNAMYPQRAAGGPVTANTPYWVGERGPELVMPQNAGTVIPNQQSIALAQSLANPQSGFTGREATREQDRVWTVLMNIEANTRKTYEGVEKWASSSAYSGSGGGGSGGSGGSVAGGGDEKFQQYLKVLAVWRSNYQAAGIVGSGNIGYGSQGLGATPEQIAHRQVYGMATGGVIGGDSRDTQKVEFFKRPRERVIIADDDQLDDRRGSSKSTSGGDRPIQLSVPITIQAGASVTKESTAELRRQATMAVREAMRGIYGR
jgi:hypothetical protein